MMIKKTRIILILSLAIACQCCILSDECDDCFTPPSPVWFIIVNANDTLQNLITEDFYSIDSIKMWYEENSQKKYVDLVLINTENFENIIQSTATFYCINGEPRDFYLYLNNSDTDTIQLQVTAHSDGCCTSFSLESIKFNGEEPPFDSVNYAYLLKKKLIIKSK